MFAPAKFPDSGPAKAELGARSARGGVSSILAQGAFLVVSLASQVVLARLLTPRDFGLFAMVASVSAVLWTFKGFGLDSATLQREKISYRQVSTLFWINLIFGFLLAILFAAAAPVIATYNNEPEVIPIVLAMSSAFAVTGLYAQHQALLQREMRFDALGLNTAMAPLLGLIAAILAAVAGWGYWSLVVQFLVNTVCLGAGIWLASRWRPAFTLEPGRVRELLAFGAHHTAFKAAHGLATQSDKILLGALWGASILGFYSQAYRLLATPLSRLEFGVSQVAIATLSRLQHDPERYGRFFVQGLQAYAALQLPLVVFTFVAADSLIPLLLGNQWIPSVPFFRALAPAFVCGGLQTATEWIYLSLGHVRRRLRWGLIETVITVGALVLGSRWGPLGIAVAFSVAVAALRIPALYYCCRDTPLRVADSLGGLWRPCVASLAAGASAFAARFVLGPAADRFVVVALLGAVFAAVYVLVWMVIPGGRNAARLWRLLRESVTERS